eukprot:2316300-Amphidinium_carterae.1
MRAQEQGLGSAVQRSFQQSLRPSQRVVSDHRDNAPQVSSASQPVLCVWLAPSAASLPAHFVCLSLLQCCSHQIRPRLITALLRRLLPLLCVPIDRSLKGVSIVNSGVCAINVESSKVVLAAVSDDGAALQYAHPALQADREVVLTAVVRNGSALRCASL